MKDKIEIPFGAKDSELKGWEYTIPEGMEAIIKDGKVIVREKESEDEEIRQALIEFLREAYSRGNAPEECAKWLVWLDRQKERKPTNSEKPKEWSEEDRTMINHIIEALPKWANGLITILPSQAEEYAKRLKSLRPCWKPSEQEKGALRTAIHILTDERNFPKAAKQLQNILDAFEGKESRKDWKPSEEQMEAFECAERWYTDNMGHNPALYQLLFDLKKL